MQRVTSANWNLHSHRAFYRLVLVAGVFGLFVPSLPSTAAQKPDIDTQSIHKNLASDGDELPTVPSKVDIKPSARDEEIVSRLQHVLNATGWFDAPQVRVKEGVVFLSGRTESDELKKWAGELARNTQDVVAVANRIEVSEPSPWDFTAARNGLSSLWRDCVRFLPFLFFGLFIMVLSAATGWLTMRVARIYLRSRVKATLLRNVIAWAIGFFVFLAGTYVVLRVSGLTQLALTVVGGTGLIGLAVGIAFRDITENFLASIFLSMQRPFETSDLIEVAGVTGFVQQLNVRTTSLITLDGNLVQVPNATVYKSTLHNFTANPNRRENFTVGIGYGDPIDRAQEIARAVLADHPAVLVSPEPWVLADSLGPSTVNLRIYFWLNGKEHSWLKVRSSIIRLVKLAFQQNGISMPDESREVVFPKGVPVTFSRKRERNHDDLKEQHSERNVPPNELDAIATKAEAGLSSVSNELENQARQAPALEEEENLLQSTAPTQRGQQD